MRNSIGQFRINFFKITKSRPIFCIQFLNWSLSKESFESRALKALLHCFSLAGFLEPPRDFVGLQNAGNERVNIGTLSKKCQQNLQIHTLMMNLTVLA